MKDYMIELYEDYMLNHCTCDRSPDQCTCLTYDDFCDMHYMKMQEEWAELLSIEMEDQYA